MAPPRPLLACFSVLLVSTALVVGAARAQVEVVPTTTIPMELPPDWYFGSDLDVAPGSDGRALLVWNEVDYSVNGPKRPHAIASRIFDPMGGGLSPIVRELFPKGAEPGLAVSGAQSRYAVPRSIGTTFDDRQLLGRIVDLDGVAVTNPTGLADVFEKGGGATLIASDGGDAGHVVAWLTADGDIRARRIGNDGSTGVEALVSSDFFARRLEVANTPDGGFVVAFGADNSIVRVRGFTAAAVPKDDVVELTLENGETLEGLAASPASDVLAVVIMQDSIGGSDALTVQRITAKGILVGSRITVSPTPDPVDADAAYDRNGNLFVVWAIGLDPFRWRAFHPNGSPFGPVGSGTVGMPTFVKTARLANRDFVNVSRQNGAIYYNVVSLCVPGSSVCGDGTVDPLCETCDDGAGNSDVAPDACRTNCEPARCGDGTIDGAETCDDGNTADCDGCSAGCLVETGLGCGDGIPFPGCGEPCDDGNGTDGDGCSDCTLERAPGGGSAGSDCFSAWSIANPSNTPRYGKSGGISEVQVCTDNDSACDFDGGTTGSCTFHVAVCANNTALTTCTPATRLATWELRTPSASQAAGRPALAAVRNAFLAAVPGSIVGPSQPDVCSPMVDVPVALRGSPGAYADGHLTLKARAALYDGRSDSDKLKLECRVAP